ncbi:MAG: GNAT family N-acetyltransferase [Microbacteriaceae bacterium]|nr:GNAT family N-acetyltransferase [Microbacteriaceae bacterium]
MTEHLTLPIDDESAERMRAGGLRLGLVDTSDVGAFGQWLEADSRGFHQPRPSAESLTAQVRGLADRRTTGVYDDSAADSASPVATVSSWPARLTLPGGTDTAAWAISAVTVASTHRRRGIASAMLTAELRTAQRLGVAVAILTVSEATIYGRFGFAPAAFAADWTIDTRKAKWAGPAASGRVHMLPLERARDDGRAIIERIRSATPGEIDLRGHLWERLFGLSGDPDRAKTLRAVRYDDADGVPQGFAVYSFKQPSEDFSAQALNLEYLATATDDAYAGLWRYLLEIDLVSTVTAPLRRVDEPVVWQLTDVRSAKKADEQDHLWTRILDVKAALEARRYRAPGAIALEVSDPLGFAGGRFLLDVSASGTAVVSPLDGEAPHGAAAVALGVGELSALYLGGVSAAVLARAGRITELRAGSADAVDAVFRTAVAPWLSIWF